MVIASELGHTCRTRNSQIVTNFRTLLSELMIDHEGTSSPSGFATRDCMNEIDYSPAKEFTGNWWSERIKPFLDFRSYLAQRRRILADPNVIFAPPVDDKNWKSPLKFAIQGLAVPTLIASLVGSIYFFLVKEPDPTYKQDERKFTEAVTKLQALESRIKAAAPDEMFHFYDESIDRPRDDAQGMS